MKTLKNRAIAIAITILLTVSMSASMMLVPSATAHYPGWQIPTYAYISAQPDPIGVGQEIHVYMWVDCVYGGAGGATAAIGTNASTSSAALTANFYRFHNYQLTITAPDGTTTTQTFPVVIDTTSNQFTKFTPDQTGTYTLNFTYPGQKYGENGNGYEKSILMNDTYLPSSASTTLTVQEEQIPGAQGSSPLPTQYWTHPIYGEGTDWWTVSSDWLGSGSPILSGYTSNRLYQPDGVGPLTSHVMWTRELQFGGVVGGNAFVDGGTNPAGAVQGPSYFEGSSYEPRFSNPIIICGKLYYTEVKSFTAPSSGPTDCIDLRTGEVLWSRTDVPPLTFGYIYNLWNGDQHGTFPPILFANTAPRGAAEYWQAYDAYTGEPMFNVTNIPVGTAVAGPTGEQIRYVIRNAGTNANPQWYLSQWNSSKLWQYDVNPYTGGGSFNPSVINASNGVVISNIPINPNIAASATAPNGLPVTVPYGSTILVNADIPINSTTLGGERGGTGVAGPGINTYDWNVSLPWLNVMPLAPIYDTVAGKLTMPPAGTNPVSVLAASYGDVMLCRNGSFPVGFKGSGNGGYQLPYTMFAVNLNASRGAVGSILWMKTYDPPQGNITMGFGAVDFQKRVWYINIQEKLNWIGYSLENGNQLWETPRQADFDYYGVGNTMLSVPAYGKLYTSGYSGTCYAFDISTGELLWTYGNGGEGNTTYAGFNKPTGYYPTFIQNIASGVIYLATNEHTIPNPIYKGATYRAINASTGEEIWQLSGYPSEWSTPGSAWATADGYLTCMNGLDNRIYSIGRGPSQLTVDAGPKSSAYGNSVVIEGTVIDTSAGTKQDQQASDFPAGVPVASDAVMKDWMGYVYQQKPLPTNFKGVDITIDVLDSNGNYRNIGTATTDTTGYYSFSWMPDIPGKFTVIATFAGTNSYWPSYSETSFMVDNAAPTASPYPTVNLPPTEMYFAASTIAIIIAIAIVGILLLRKKP
jgi:hypothetical protein